MEFPHLMRLMDENQFDTIYHEHLCYFSVIALDYLFRRNGLYLTDVERLSIHGGSLRLYIGLYEDVQESVRMLLGKEQELGIDDYSYYQGFSLKVRSFRKQMRELLFSLKT